MVGLLGGVHCVGMCGGIVSAFAVATPRRPFPVAISTAVGLPAAIADSGWRVLAFNAGRLGSYMIAGAIAGLIGSVPAMIHMASVQTAAYWLANLMLVALGLTLMNVWHGLSHIESIGQIAWKRMQPLMRKLVPVQHLKQAFALGGLWGWVPCGMVYSVLMTSLLTGSVWQGALVMLVFGLGTLPLLLSMGVAGVAMQPMLQKRTVRIVAGLLVLAFGILGIARVSMGLSYGWLDSLCMTPTMH